MRDGRRGRAPGGIARHARLKRSGPVALVAKVVASALAVVLVASVSVGAYAVWQLTDIETVDLVLDEDEAAPPAPPALGRYEGGFDMLIAASDQADGNINEAGRDEMLNDFTMLLHVAEDQQSAVAISFPRDLLVPIRSCPREEELGGGTYPSMSSQQINVTLTYGGLPCTVKTVSDLTGLSIKYAGLIKFGGVVEMSTAVGGVDVCIDGPLVDRKSGIDLPAAGTYPLEGEQARAFLRTRYGVGDNSDLARISSQQLFLSSLIRKLKSDDTLTDVPKLYNVARAATSNMTLSSSLPPTTMVSMAMVLKDIPLERITFVQYPSSPSENRVVPNRAQAEALMQKVLADESFLPEATGVGAAVVGADGTESATPGATQPAPTDPAVPTDPGTGTPAPDPSAPAQPEVLSGVTGQTAADETCSRTG